MKNTNRFTLGVGGPGVVRAAPGEHEQCGPGESTAAETEKKNTWTTAPIIDVGMRWEQVTRSCTPSC